MKRSAIAAAIVALTLTAVFVLRSRPADDERRARPALSLNLKFPLQRAVMPGTPVAFEITLSGLSEGPAFSVGNRWSAWADLINVTLRRGGAPVAVEVIRTGKPSDFRVARDPKRASSVEAQGGGRATIHGRDYFHVISLAIAPDASARLATGRYSITAALATPWWQVRGWRGRVEAAAVTLDVAEQSDALIRQRLSTTASYWLQTGQPASAERAARELVAFVPASSEAHILLGDALMRQGKKMEAWSAFSEALSLVEAPSASEPPSRVFERMAALFPRDGKPWARGRTLPSSREQSK